MSQEIFCSTTHVNEEWYDGMPWLLWLRHEVEANCHPVHQLAGKPGNLLNLEIKWHLGQYSWKEKTTGTNNQKPPKRNYAIFFLIYTILWSDVWNVSYIELRIWNQVSYDHRSKYFNSNYIHKWWPRNDSFVFVLTILTSLTFKQKLFWILYVLTRLVGMISIKTKE